MWNIFIFPFCGAFVLRVSSILHKDVLNDGLLNESELYHWIDIQRRWNIQKCTVVNDWWIFMTLGHETRECLGTYLYRIQFLQQTARSRTGYFRRHHRPFWLPRHRTGCQASLPRCDVCNNITLSHFWTYILILYINWKKVYLVCQYFLELSARMPVSVQKNNLIATSFSGCGD